MTIAASGFSDVHVFKLALSDSVGETQFFVTAVAEASSLLKPEQRLMALSKEHKYDFRKTVVSASTLDFFVNSKVLTVLTGLIF